MKKGEFKSASAAEVAAAIAARSKDGSFGDLVKYIDKKLARQLVK